jgi:midasin
MAALQDPWNALSIPLAVQIEAFLRTCPEQDSLRDAPVAEQLATLSRLLKTPEYTIFVARLFSPLLVDICARWLDDNEQDELKFAAFGLLVPAHEELYPYVSNHLILLV